MPALSYREWGAVIGVVLVVLGAWLGVGITAVAIVCGIIGYLVGRFLEGELDIGAIQQRARGRRDLR
jgi:hypothetical protein